MSARPRAAGSTKPSPPYVSTGHLPPPEQVRALVAEAHERFKSNTEGENSQVYPALARVPSDLFGICVVGTNGNVYAVGDAEYEFTIMSVSKPFVFALVCQALGAEQAREKLGVNATGLRVQLARRHRAERRTGGRTRWSIPGRSPRPAWCRARRVDAEVAVHPRRPVAVRRPHAARSTTRCTPPRRETNHRNQSIARLLQSYGRIYVDPAEAIDLYTKQCSLNVSAKDLAVMGATLADGGVNPLTKERVVDPAVCHYALAVMATAGLYETSGRLALRHRAAGQERHRRRDRHRLSGQGRAGDLRPAARQGRQQRQGAARGQVPVRAAGHGPVRLAAGGLNPPRAPPPPHPEKSVTR